jgi:2-polyprenyl-3-methyl-5-hydroxy-6-metoxy-1,4-benzoquinol methylase
MTLMSQAYQREQQLLHEQPAYGSRGFNWGYLIAGIAKIEGCSSVLDYGCGKGTLGKTLKRAGIDVRSYDPAIEEFSSLPKPADLVACVDVLEHIEQECLDEVLDHMAAVTKKILFVAISTRLAKRWLTDGRNTHLIVQSAEWWRPLFEQRGFVVRRVWDSVLPEWVAMMEKKR